MTHDEIALNWYCTHCNFEFSPDVGYGVTVREVLELGLKSHRVHSPDCRWGELHFESQFIGARENETA